MTDPKTIREDLREFALGLPAAYEDFPWGESAIKVNKKVFIFLGVEDSDEYPLGITVKLREFHAEALAIEDVAPAGYGLGRSGWVAIPLAGGLPPIEVLQDWVEESYRLVAPKKLIAELDQGATG